MKVLVCEDDTKIRNGLVEILRNEGYQAIGALDGEQAWALYRSEQPDFICLDIMMPGISGYDLCRKIRKQDEHVPIMIITAKSEEVDRVVGLELGADDYLVKPFGMNEVISRIRAITRRCFRNSLNQPDSKGEEFEIAGMTVRPRELSAVQGDCIVELSLRDVRILHLLAREQGRVVDRDTLFNECWGMDYLPNSRTLDQHISKLRKKIGDDPRNPKVIETVHGVGYRYRGEGKNFCSGQAE